MDEGVEQSTGYVVILTTTDNRSIADRIADALIDNRLAACVQIDGPIKSFYRWEGKVETDDEYRLVIKTARHREQEVYRAIRSIHSYELPQIVSLPLTGGLTAYLRWIDEQVKPLGS